MSARALRRKEGGGTLGVVRPELIGWGTPKAAVGWRGGMPMAATTPTHAPQDTPRDWVSFQRTDSGTWFSDPGVWSNLTFLQVQAKVKGILSAVEPGSANCRGVALAPAYRDKGPTWSACRTRGTAALPGRARLTLRGFPEDGEGEGDEEIEQIVEVGADGALQGVGDDGTVGVSLRSFRMAPMRASATAVLTPVVLVLNTSSPSASRRFEVYKTSMTQTKAVQVVSLAHRSNTPQGVFKVAIVGADFVTNYSMDATSASSSARGLGYLLEAIGMPYKYGVVPTNAAPVFTLLRPNGQPIYVAAGMAAYIFPGQTSQVRIPGLSRLALPQALQPPALVPPYSPPPSP